jgi:hypothetical protein
VQELNVHLDFFYLFLAFTTNLIWFRSQFWQQIVLVPSRSQLWRIEPRFSLPKTYYKSPLNFNKLCTSFMSSCGKAIVTTYYVLITRICFRKNRTLILKSAIAVMLFYNLKSLSLRMNINYNFFSCLPAANISVWCNNSKKELQKLHI